MSDHTKPYVARLHYIDVELQGRNEVRWRLGQETRLAPPGSNLRSFGSKCAVETSSNDIVATF